MGGWLGLVPYHQFSTAFTCVGASPRKFWLESSGSVDAKKIEIWRELGARTLVELKMEHAASPASWGTVDEKEAAARVLKLKSFNKRAFTRDALKRLFESENSNKAHPAGANGQSRLKVSGTKDSMIEAFARYTSATGTRLFGRAMYDDFVTAAVTASAVPVAECPVSQVVPGASDARCPKCNHASLRFMEGHDPVTVDAANVKMYDDYVGVLKKFGDAAGAKGTKPATPKYKRVKYVCTCQDITCATCPGNTSTGQHCDGSISIPGAGTECRCSQGCLCVCNFSFDEGNAAKAYRGKPNTDTRCVLLLHGHLSWFHRTCAHLHRAF